MQYHLCKTNAACQEQAVVAGLVPHLCTLLSAPPGLLPALSTPLLCALAATSARVRQVRTALDQNPGHSQPPHTYT